MRPRLPPRAVLSLVALAGAACGDRGEPTEATALRERFPEHAAEVLDRGSVFEVTASGFAARAGRLDVELPRHGGGAVRLRLAGGFEARVREVGPLGEGRATGHAVAYPGLSGTSYWNAHAEGLEEWLALEGGPIRPGEPVAAWEVEGATLAEVRGAVIVRDVHGRARLRVTAPAAYGADHRPVRAHLAARGSRLELSVEATPGEAVLVDPSWSSTGLMNEARTGAIAALLPSGDVLVTGGSGDATSELYDPASDAWTLEVPSNVARVAAAGAVLPSGRVLVCGGLPATAMGSGALASAELYDPVAHTWTVVAPMFSARAGHTATLLANGAVLVVGGFAGGPGAPVLARAELYDPLSGGWSPVPDVPAARALHTATEIGDGSVIVTGGVGPGGVLLASAERLDTVTGAWSSLAPMSQPRARHRAVWMPGYDELLVAGGDSLSGATSSAELYDPAVSAWSSVPVLATPRSDFALVWLPEAFKALVAGGSNQIVAQLAGAELFDPQTKTWAALPPMTEARAQPTGTLLANGDVLVAGGSASPSGELYRVGQPGDPCGAQADCLDGHCVGGVCCNTSCLGPCAACSRAAGAPLDGTCALLDGPACDDGNACAHAEICVHGACTAKSSVTCSGPSACREAGSCDPSDGACSSAAKPDGTPCPGGACHAGTCAPRVPTPPGSSGTAGREEDAGAGGAPSTSSADGQPRPGGEACGCSNRGVGADAGLLPAAVAALVAALLRRRRRLG